MYIHRNKIGRLRVDLSVGRIFFHFQFFLEDPVPPYNYKNVI